MVAKWFIRPENVLNAIAFLNDPKNNKATFLGKKIAHTLRQYREFGEFDGTLASAIKCLKQSEYDMDMDVKEDT